MDLAIGVVHAAIRGYHVYKTFWTPKYDVILTTERDQLNAFDKHCVAIKESVIIIGHIPREISRLCNFFLKRGGTIQVEVTDTQCRRSNIKEGGLEIPAIIIFTGTERDIRKVLSVAAQFKLL
jgi:ABC-type multidrug transport system ATPase subunit